MISLPSLYHIKIQPVSRHHILYIVSWLHHDLNHIIQSPPRHNLVTIISHHIVILLSSPHPGRISHNQYIIKISSPSLSSSHHDLVIITLISYPHHHNIMITSSSSLSHHNRIITSSLSPQSSSSHPHHYHYHIEIPSPSTLYHGPSSSSPYHDSITIIIILWSRHHNTIFTSPSSSHYWTSYSLLTPPSSSSHPITIISWTRSRH